MYVSVRRESARSPPIVLASVSFAFSNDENRSSLSPVSIKKIREERLKEESGNGIESFKEIGDMTGQVMDINANNPQEEGYWHA
jgi:hypothetical protein